MIDKLLKVDSTKDNLVDQIEDLQERISELERFALTSQDIVATSIDCSGDIYTAEWIDYSALSTIVGWTSYTEKEIWYKKVGKLVFVQYRIQGTSDATTVSITLPYSQNSGIAMHSLVRVRDDSAWQTDAGVAMLSAGASTVNFWLTLVGSSATWTASGDKAIVGQFCYESD